MMDFEITGKIIVKAIPRHEYLRPFHFNKKVYQYLIESGIDLLSFPARNFLDDKLLPFTFSEDNIALLHISNFDEWWKLIGHSSRKHVRKAEKYGLHVLVVDGNDIQDFMLNEISKIYNESPIRQNRYFLHYGESFTRRRLEEALRYEYHFACLDKEIIGFIEVVYGDRVALISQILSMMKHFDKSPNNLLLSSVVKQCAKFGYTFLIYGRMGLAHPSLTKFKEQNGFYQCDINRYYVPLTHKGAVAIKLGIHRPLKDIIPDKIKYALLPMFTFISRNFGVEL